MEFWFYVAIISFAIANIVVSVFNYFTHQRNAQVVQRENDSLRKVLDAREATIKRQEARIIVAEKEGSYWLKKSLQADSPVALLVHNNGVSLVTQKEVDVLNDSRDIK